MEAATLPCLMEQVDRAARLLWLSLADSLLIVRLFIIVSTSRLLRLRVCPFRRWPVGMAIAMTSMSTSTVCSDRSRPARTTHG